MSLLCFVWDQPRQLKFSYLPLIFASLEEIDYLLLDTASAWAKAGTAIAASFAEIRHVAGVSLPSRLAAALTSLAPLCRLTSRLGHWIRSWTWEPATSRSPVILPPARHSLPAWPWGCWESRQSRGVPSTPPGLRCNPSTSRGKVSCFLTRGLSPSGTKATACWNNLTPRNKQVRATQPM